MGFLGEKMLIYVDLLKVCTGFLGFYIGFPGFNCLFSLLSFAFSLAVWAAKLPIIDL